ncbi:MAG: GNAT family N-acetyltransferase [Pyrinomonadaceae bacterium]|nr:GNAT family N-acetyltransferase [Pyrinomonadaceae bacterium]
MSEIRIRRATPDDAKLLTDLSYTTFWDAFAHHPKNAPDDLDHYMRQAFNQDQIAAELSDERSIFLVAELEGKPAGYAKLITDSTEDEITADRPIELSRLYSHQEYIGKGVGQNLMDACFELACANGHDVIWLGVWEYNPRAQRFYEKNGFSIVGRHIFQLGSDPQTDLLMQKELQPAEHTKSAE